MLKVAGLAGVGLLTVGTAACGKNISLYTATVIGSLEELIPLLPNLSDRLKQAVMIAKTFDESYRAGKFADAATIFENLTTSVQQIISGIGVMNEQVKLAVAVGGVALRGIAVLLRQQAAQPAVAAMVAKSNSSAKSMIERMADPAIIDEVVAAVKP